MIVSLMHRTWYSAKLIMSGYGYAAIIYWILLLAVLTNVERWSIGNADVATIIAVLLIGFPLFHILLFAGLFAEDMEERTFGLLFTYPHKTVMLLLERIAPALFLSVAAYASCLVCAHYLLVPLTADQIGEIGKRVWPANGYLALLALLCSLAGRSVLAGLGVAAGYWMLELITMGKWTGPLFLFQNVFHNRDVSTWENAAWLTSAAAVCMGLSVIVFVYGRRRWVR